MNTAIFYNMENRVVSGIKMLRDKIFPLQNKCHSYEMYSVADTLNKHAIFSYKEMYLDF